MIARSVYLKNPVFAVLTIAESCHLVLQKMCTRLKVMWLFSASERDNMHVWPTADDDAVKVIGVAIVEPFELSCRSVVAAYGGIFASTDEHVPRHTHITRAHRR